MKIFKSWIFNGCLLALIIFSISLFNHDLAFKASGVIGGLLVILAMVFSGALNSGDRLRANNVRETKEERIQRVDMSGVFFKLRW
ncbi:DUF5316 family protein [Paenibacillus zanthoxyli]|uniref:DUF5316 family protein n=1 Tax=Paenibacillus zanthoxyli TaxID=369399 RepID=UPI0004724648|nr:DUF5316 family protein [Paenibacillus zanthoxyli]